MAEKTIDESPKTTDSIVFEIETPDADGCFNANPYKVDRLVVYYVERDFLGKNYGEYEQVIIQGELQEELKEAEKQYCDDPSAENAYILQKIRNEIDSSSQKSVTYYKDRVAVHIVGKEGFPAWLSTDTDNAYLTLVEEDDDGNAQFGRFTYTWDPKGSIREGDYFVCWTWTPLAAGEKLSAHLPFKIGGDPKAVITIPTHATAEHKYETLVDRYLPEMYKCRLSTKDITPEVTQSLNNAIADGFTFVEDMANQVIDLFDANALHESLLVYLSNLFCLKLKSSDPTLWRRQIKEAVTGFKKKGTYRGLESAFSSAGMRLDKYTQFWQIVSPYTWQESFKVVDTDTFKLDKETLVEPIDEDNFYLGVLREGEDEYTEYSKDYVEFYYAEDCGGLHMGWIGDSFSANPVTLNEGDIVRVRYQYKEIPGSYEQTLEDYIQSLPLADQRDETEQEYPPKNWNVRIIAEEDPLFDILVPVRQPFNDPLIFGYIRTEFAYSENIYNMEEYNGSTRPSTDACSIDKSFLDPCGACLGSKYSVDVSVEELSNDRILEAQDILREYMPFHAQLHSINFLGEFNDFVQSPVELIDTLVTYNFTQSVISGNVNKIFDRVMQGARSNYIVTREDLTDQLTVLSGKMGTAYNDHVALISPDHFLDNLRIIGHSHVMEVLSPSPNAGTYLLRNPNRNTAEVASEVIEPVDETAFTFNISNVQYKNNVSSITQDDLVELSDEEVPFQEIGVKTQWDVENTPDYTGGPWKVLISDYSATPYEIVDIANGVLRLDGDTSLPVSTTTDVAYSLLDDNDDVIETGTSGVLSVTRRAYVDLNDTDLEDTRQVADLGDQFLYDGQEYEIVGFDENNFWIDGYEDGDASSVSIEIRRRLITEAIGYFGYRGMRLITFSDHETEFGIVNGDNPPGSADDVTDDSKFKENFMFKIDDNYFKIASINGDQVVITGQPQTWTTLDNGGTVVDYSVVHFPKKEVNIGFTVFDQLGRDGKDTIIRQIESTVDDNVAIVALSMPSSGGMQENLGMEEGISFSIVYKDGQEVEGEL